MWVYSIDNGCSNSPIFIIFTTNFWISNYFYTNNISGLQLHGQGFSPVCKVHGKLDYYAVKQLNHIDYIDMDHYYNTAVWIQLKEVKK